jgi:hypothetical protein
MSRVFRKTALGIAAFAKKDAGLSAAQRALLVMVDGKRSASDLRRFAATFGNVNAILRTLYDASLIELDPGYVEGINQAQSEIAKENAAMGISFGVDTVAAATVARSVAAPPPALKRDLRDFGAQVLAATSDPQPSATRVASQGAALSLAPIAENGDDFSVSSVAPSTLQDAKDFAKRFVFDALGNSGTALCLALERADMLKSFLETSKVARDTLRGMRGEKTAGDFDRQLREVLLR